MTAKERLEQIKSLFSKEEKKEEKVEELAAEVAVEPAKADAEDAKPEDETAKKLDELMSKFDALDAKIKALEAPADNKEMEVEMSKLSKAVEGILSVQSEMAESVEKLSIPIGPIAGKNEEKAVTKLSDEKVNPNVASLKARLGMK